MSVMSDESSEVQQLRNQIERQAELIRQKLGEIRFPPVDLQRLLDSGVNVFAVQLLAESLGKLLDSHSEAVFFEVEHRGVRLNVKAQKL